MLDIGFSELMVIGIVALIVVGPKDLPKLFRTLGEATGKARGMARQFSRAMNDAANESGVGNIAGDLRKMANPSKLGLDTLKKNVTEATSSLTNLDPDSETGRLSAERKAQADKIREYSAQKAQERLDREAAAKSTAPVIEATAEGDGAATASADAEPSAKPAES